jgi:tRNA threonylcarbamoyladenosine biosynthesis protein TsaB
MTIPLAILAIDTATDVCSVALLTREGVIERSERVGQKHSERALPMVDALLAEAGYRVTDLGAVAFGAGPGSFTGLRIACGLAQGLAWAAELPVVAVGNLRALAAAALAEDASAQRVLCAVDARMNESYVAIYEREGAIESLIEREPPQLVAPHELADMARANDCDLVAGDALVHHASAWPAQPPWRSSRELNARAAWIARLGAADFRAGRSIAPALAAPLYVRDRVALTSAERADGERL